MPVIIGSRFERDEFISQGERLARELTALLSERLVGMANPREELAKTVERLIALGHPLRLEQSDDDFESWVDDQNDLALYIHREPGRIDRVEVLWQRT